MGTLKNSHCCKDLTSLADDEYCPIFYNGKFREYAIRDIESTSYITLVYCPFCSTKLPKSLRDEWFNALQSEYDIKATILTPLNELPKEFHTNEWWKKRDL